MPEIKCRGFTPFLRFRNSWFWLGRRPELVAGRGREADHPLHTAHMCGSVQVVVRHCEKKALDVWEASQRLGAKRGDVRPMSSSCRRRRATATGEQAQPSTRLACRPLSACTCAHLPPGSWLTCRIAPVWQENGLNLHDGADPREA
jgi:hypothetical protein